MIAPPAGRLRLSPALAVALAGGQGTRQWLPRRHGPLRRAIVNPMDEHTFPALALRRAMVPARVFTGRDPGGRGRTMEARR